LSWTSAEEDIEWVSFLVVFGGVDFGQDDEKPFSRTYFHLSMVLLTFAELGALDLDEGMDRNEVMGVYNTVNI
jgi:ribulose 1,5-bisphosphate carboxylase large subunit-like protein